jgi:hypothetical protein
LVATKERVNTAMHAPFLTVKLTGSEIVYKKNMRGRVRVRPDSSFRGSDPGVVGVNSIRV